MSDIESYSTDLGANQISEWEEKTTEFDVSARPAEVTFTGAVSMGLAQAAFDSFIGELTESFDHNRRLADSVGGMLSGVHQLVSKDHGGFGVAADNYADEVSGTENAQES